MDPKQTRGYANCNPGNMDRGAETWVGEIRDPSLCKNDIQRQELLVGRFCVFTDAQHGIRAMALNLRAYHDRLGCRTIRDYINRWAPPNENNTEGYIARVANTLGISADVPFQLWERVAMKAIATGIINVECAGMPYEAGEIDEGLTLAGVPA